MYLGSYPYFYANPLKRLGDLFLLSLYRGFLLLVLLVLKPLLLVLVLKLVLFFIFYFFISDCIILRIYYGASTSGNNI